MTEYQRKEKETDFALQSERNVRTRPDRQTPEGAGPRAVRFTYVTQPTCH